MLRFAFALALAASGALVPVYAAAPVDCAAPVPRPLTLAAAELRLTPCNRDVRAAMLAVDAALADKRVALQQPNPNFFLGASNVNPHAGIGAGGLRDKTFDSFVRVEQLVERGGKATLRASQADFLLEAAIADLAEQERQQRLNLRSAYFELAAAQERLRLQRDFRQIAAESANAARLRFQAQEISKADANRITLDAARVENDLRQAAIEEQRARYELARLIGAEAYASSLEVEIAWNQAVPRASPRGARPDVVAARRRAQAAEAARDLARSLATRDVTVGLQADRWPVSETNLQGTGISYGVSVSIPLHVRHSHEGEAARAMADLDSARASVERSEAQAAAEARLADEEWRAASERRRRVEDEVQPLARDVAKSAEFAYARGATGVLDLLDARRSLKAVELDEVQARADAAKAWAKREAAREAIEE